MGMKTGPLRARLKFQHHRHEAETGVKPNGRVSIAPKRLLGVVSV
jgi:hypothetical protein